MEFNLKVRHRLGRWWALLGEGEESMLGVGDNPSQAVKSLCKRWGENLSAEEREAASTDRPPQNFSSGVTTLQQISNGEEGEYTMFVSELNFDEDDEADEDDRLIVDKQIIWAVTIAFCSSLACLTRISLLS